MHQIARVSGQRRIAAGELAALCRPGEGQAIAEVDGMEERFQLVKPVRALAEDVQQQVDLAGR
jgi:hypothetical protein